MDFLVLLETCHSDFFYKVVEVTLSTRLLHILVVPRYLVLIDVDEL